ncbi:MAG: hypothetical protein IJ635_04345 [Bacteroidaceae bacterium]|nr:hypothetical protein [Bacteroidaceae bacterium]
MKRFLLSLFAVVAAVININAADEITLWEGEQDLQAWALNWEVPTGTFSGKVHAGDEVRIYLSQKESDGYWSLQLYDGHWGQFVIPQYAGHAINGDNESIEDGYVSITLDDALAAVLNDYDDWGYNFIIQGAGIVTKITVVPSEGEDLTGDIVGNYTFDYAASSIYGGTRPGAKMPVTIEKASNSSVTIKGLGHDFVASILANGDLYVDKQNYPYTTQTEAGNDTIVDFIISGRTVSTWETVYDEQGNWAGGVWNYTYADSTAFILQNGFYTLPDGIQIGSQFIKDGVLLKEGGSLPGDVYTVAANVYENGDFNLELMRPEQVWSTLNDTLNVVVDGDKVQFTGLFGLGIVEGTVLSDGSLSFIAPDNSFPLNGGWQEQADGSWGYAPFLFVPTETGYEFSDPDAGYAWFVFAYGGKVQLIKGEVDPEAYTTAIKAAEVAAPAVLDFSKPVYNVAGQRVGASAKGILIQNGRKFLVK